MGASSSIAFGETVVTTGIYLPSIPNATRFCVVSDGTSAIIDQPSKRSFIHIDCTTGVHTKMAAETTKLISTPQSWYRMLAVTRSWKNYIIALIVETETKKCFLASFLVHPSKAIITDEKYLGVDDQESENSFEDFLQSKKGQIYYVLNWHGNEGENQTYYHLVKIDIGNSGKINSTVIVKRRIIKGEWYHPFFHDINLYWLSYSTKPHRKLLKATPNGELLTEIEIDNESMALELDWSPPVLLTDNVFFYAFDSEEKIGRLGYLDFNRKTWKTLQIDMGGHAINGIYFEMKTSQDGRLFLQGQCCKESCKAKAHIYIIDPSAQSSPTTSQQDKRSSQLSNDSRGEVDGIERAPQNELEQWTIGKYERLQKIGFGAHGIIFKCKDNATKRIFAAKQSLLPTKKSLEAALNEVEKLKGLRHEGIIRYYGSRFENDFVVIFMEYMSGGSLHQIISQNGPLIEQNAKKYTEHILEGLAYIHEKGIVHMDLKCANFLIDAKGNVKLGDFGIAIQQVYAENDGLLESSRTGGGGGGTLHWMAPEIFNGEQASFDSDVWSFGCAVIEMLTGKPPHANLTVVKFFIAIGNKTLSYSANDLVPNTSKARKIGSGQYGTVYLCRDPELGTFFAAKQTNYLNDEMIRLAKNEIEVLQTLCHSRIVTYLGSKVEVHKITIFMEYMPGGSLAQHIKLSGNLSEETTRKYTLQILEGLDYIHGCYVHGKTLVHSDLKCGNIMFDGHDNVKLGDFGIAVQKMLDDNGESKFGTGATAFLGGTLHWMAPELISGEGFASRRTDIWSLGCTIVEMLTGNPPYINLPSNNFMAAVFNKSLSYEPKDLLPNDSSPLLLFFLSQLLQHNPTDRPHTAAIAIKCFNENISKSESELIMKKDLQKQTETEGPPSPISKQGKIVNYDKQEKLREGRFDITYKCWDKDERRFFVAKEILPQLEEAAKNAIKTLSSLNHQRIIQLYGHKYESGLIHLFLEYLPGGSLRESIDQEGPIKETTALKFIDQILDGLDFIHCKGIVHSDIKCTGDSFLLDGQGNLKFGEFGIAVQKFINTRNQSFFTRTNMHADGDGASFFFMAPEVIDGTEDVSRTSDVWSLGCTIVEMLTGKPPYAELSRFQFLLQASRKSLSYRPADLVPRASEKMCEFLKCLFEIDRSMRPRSAENVVEIFEQTLKKL